MELPIVGLASHLAFGEGVLDARRSDLRLRDRERARVIVELASALEPPREDLEHRHEHERKEQEGDHDFDEGESALASHG